MTKTRDLVGQVALVTGAGKGIGRAVSLKLAEAGMKVGLVARTGDDLDTVAKEIDAIGGGSVVLVGDVGDREFVEAAVQTVERDLGPIDLLLNNAARSASWNWEKFWEVDPDDWWERVTTNLRGPALFSRYVLPGMVTRGSGRVAQMNSLAGAAALPMTDGAYPVSKSGLFRLTEQLAAQLVDTGVVVLDLSPGLVKTQANDTAQANDMAIPDSAWTPMERITTLVLRVARGEFDAFSGRFVHAEDDLDRMLAEVEAIKARDGRSLRMRPAYDNDPKVPVPAP